MRAGVAGRDIALTWLRSVIFRRRICAGREIMTALERALQTA